MNNPLNSDKVPPDPEQNYVVSYRRQPRIYADLRPQPVKFWLPGDFLHFGAKQAQHQKCMERAIRSDKVCNLLQVARDVRRQSQSH